MRPIGQKIRPLSIGDVRQAVLTSEAALSRDPLQLYIRNTPDPQKNYFAETWRINIGIQFAAAARKGKIWTVGDVFAVMNYDPADEAKGIPDKILDRVWSLYRRYVTPRVLSEVQLRRRAEWIEKFDKMIEDTLGEKAKTMYYLELLVTRPEHQGHGYGSALVKLLTTFADAHGRDTWLISSNIENTGFYNSLGFVTKAQVSVGEDDADWDKPPVVVSLMVREVPESLREAQGPVKSAERHDPTQRTEA